MVNVRPAWEAGWTGAGVQIVFNDDGLSTSHPDLSSKFTTVGSCVGAAVNSPDQVIAANYNSLYTSPQPYVSCHHLLCNLVCELLPSPGEPRHRMRGDRARRGRLVLTGIGPSPPQWVPRRRLGQLRPGVVPLGPRGHAWRLGPSFTNRELWCAVIRRRLVTTAGANNSECSVGIAPGATLAGCPMLGEIGGAALRRVLSFGTEVNDISSNSWGRNPCTSLQHLRRVEQRVSAFRQRRTTPCTSDAGSGLLYTQAITP